jgi:hypothetical protein
MGFSIEISFLHMELALGCCKMSAPDISLSDGAPGTPTVSVITSPLIVASVVFPVLAAVAIGLRLLAKRRGGQAYHADDWWVIATWVCLASHIYLCFSVLSFADR